MSAINMAALIRTMDQGVLETAKELYRRTLPQKGMVNDFTIFLKKVTMLKSKNLVIWYNLWHQENNEKQFYSNTEEEDCFGFEENETS